MSESVDLDPEEALLPVQEDNVSHPSGAIVYMLRTAQQHHVNLSSLADAKASFLNGICLVVVTLTVTQWSKGPVPLPLITLATGALFGSLFATLAIMPRFRRGSGSSMSFNPLFFGHFADLTEEEYQDRMRSLFRSEREVYGALVRDIYQMGVILKQRKYHYLSWGFRAFITGIMATFVAGVVQLIIDHGTAH